MKKLKEIYNVIKENLENPRMRAAVILSMYLIFFIIIFGLINSGKSETNTLTPNNEEEIINYSSIQQEYEYQYNIEINEKEKTLKYLITGKESEREKSSLIKIYNEETNKYEIDTSYDKLYNEDFVNIKNIINLVNNINYEYTTEYKNGNILKNFLVPLNKINFSFDTNKNIEINIYEYNNFINKIVIDLTNLEKINNENIESVLYTLEYKNI